MEKEPELYKNLSSKTCEKVLCMQTWIGGGGTHNIRRDLFYRTQKVLAYALLLTYPLLVRFFDPGLTNKTKLKIINLTSRYTTTMKPGLLINSFERNYTATFLMCDVKCCVNCGPVCTNQ